MLLAQLEGTSGLVIVLGLILTPIGLMLLFFAQQSLIRAAPRDSEGGWYSIERVGEWPEPTKEQLEDSAQARADGVCGVCDRPLGWWFLRQFRIECPNCEGQYCFRCRRVMLVEQSRARRALDVTIRGRVRLRCVYCLHEWNEALSSAG